MGDLIDDAGGGTVEDVVGDTSPIGGHEVGGGDAAQRQGVVVGAEVAHNTHRAHVGQHRKVLVDRFVQASFGNLVAEDEISLAQDVSTASATTSLRSHRQRLSGNNFRGPKNPGMTGFSKV